MDSDDHALFEACASAPDVPVAPGCDFADLDGDGDGDQSDFGLWQLLYTGTCDCAPLIKEPPNGQPGNPMRNVYLFSGEVYETAVDLRIKGRGLDFVWARKYRSRIGRDTEQGNGWDYSYNIRLEQAGSHLRLYGGNNRADVYRLQPNGTWTRHEFFRVLNKDPGNTYTLTFPNRLTWNFNPLNGSPAEGKISSIVDRNNNALSFEYDPSGRLTTIHDTLDTGSHNRDITIAYDGNGRIESVTDYSGREVRYQYYDGIIPGGNLGDLKSARSPIVSGTPNGNDFPAGKTTVYTYSSGFVDDRLNHNLLTITDPNGQLFLTNTYAGTTDPADLEFDRVQTQIWGTQPDDRLDAIYLAQIPGPPNNFATLRAIVNDRVGNVNELFYDDDNRCVIRRDYTGRGPNPDAPTTDVANRPTGKLRASDPAFFETGYEWNDDSLPTRVLHPNQNETLFAYDGTNPSPRSRGNLLEIHRFPGPLGGDQPDIVEEFDYDPGLNADTNQITQGITGRGTVATFAYDAQGNCTQTTDRIPSIMNDFEYNAFGQRTKHTHPDNGSGADERRSRHAVHRRHADVGGGHDADQPRSYRAPQRS